MRIKITVPQKKNDMWKLSIGAGSRRRKSSQLIYGVVERHFKRSLASQLKEKTDVLIIYDQRHDLTNLSERSLDSKYILRILAQFLEDYLPKEYVQGKEKQYAV